MTLTEAVRQGTAAIDWAFAGEFDALTLRLIAAGLGADHVEAVLDGVRAELIEQVTARLVETLECERLMSQRAVSGPH